MKTLRILLLTILFPILLFAHKYEISVAAIFQNESKYLTEWIDYHQIIGVDHFYLYNNGSSDNFMDILKPYIDEGVVEVVDFPNTCLDKPWNYGTQPACYRAALERSRGESKWLCIIDIDEFLVPAKHKTLKKAFKQYPKACKAIYANWLTFGTSYKYVKEGEWIITHLTKRAKIDNPNNHHGKSIVQPDFVVTCADPHFVELMAPHGYFDGSGKQWNGGVNIDLVRIHHYTYRDEGFMRGEKSKRVRIWGYDPEQTIYKQNDAYNEEDDYRMLEILYGLK
jgi:hypothetical protein